MYQGNWTCSKCGGTITELPFEPRGNAGLTCRTCYAKSKGSDNGQSSVPAMAVAGEEAPDAPEDAGFATEPAPGDDLGMGEVPATPGDKPKFAGNWTCAGCGGAITSLPFTPRDTSNLKCLDCFKKNKA